MKLFTALLLLLSPPSFAFSVTAANCPGNLERLDNTAVQTVPGKRDCFVTVATTAFTNMVYRDFLFSTSGLFMIFNSFGPGPESENLGAREYYFFPRDAKPMGYEYDAATKRLRVTAPSGKIFTFNTEKTLLVDISNTTFSQDYNVDKGNKGGIEIVQNDGVYLDVGFTIGQSPSQNPRRKINFFDAQKNNCRVKNSEVFNTTVDSDIIFKFDDSQLGHFLGSRCPQLRP